MDPETRQTLDALNRAFEDFKANHQRQLDEVRAQGTASAETTQAVERANAQIQDLQNQMRALETRANRPGNGGDPVDPQSAARRSGFYAFMRGREIAPDVRAALVEDSTGQILVPEDVESGIRRALAQENIMRRLATVRTTQSNRVRRRNLTEVSVGWGKLELGDSLVESTPTPSEGFIYIEDMYGLVRVGEDELMDADVNLQQTIDDSFGVATADKEETAFVLGTGHANDQPEGFTLGATVTRVNAAATGVVTADDLLTLMYAVPSQYRRNGSFLVNSTTELAMRKFKDSDGQYLWQPSLAADRPATFAGRPIYNQEDLVNIPAAGVAADPAAFGDWKRGYLIIDRLGMRVKRLNELYATSGMVGFLAHQRVGGGVVDAAALRILRVPAA